MHGPNPGYQAGNYWMECDLCGFDRRASDIRENSDGLYVCADTCWEPRHPLERIRAIPDDQSVPVARPGTTSNTHTAGSVTADDL